MRTSEEMFPVVEAWLQSGLTQKAYSQRHDLPLHILPYWTGRYRNVQQGSIVSPPELSQGHFIPVSTNKEMKGGMEIVLPTGVVIRFASPVPVSYLHQLLKVCSA